MGLLEVKTGNGVYVRETPFGLENLSGNLKWLIDRHDQVSVLLEVREVLQGRAAQLCTENITEAQLRALDETVQAMEAAKDHGDMEAVTEADTRFHCLIGEFSGNELLNDLIQHIERAYRESSRALMDLKGRSTISIQEHASVLEAIKAHDGPLAEKRMQDHIADVRADLDALLKDK
jgi:DNA-binding FadR family transcriptional regulator